MQNVDGKVVKQLRNAKRWSQEELATKTGLDKQTLSRIERGERSRNRIRTIEQLARVLGVSPAVLKGEEPAPDVKSEPSPLDQAKSPLSIRMSNLSRNALALTALRYGIDKTRIVELAPFLFVCVAEQCLRARSEQIAEVEKLCEAATTAETSIRHLPLVDYSWHSEERIHAERRSIEQLDLFGTSVDNPDAQFDFDLETENPFALFLRNLSKPFPGIAEFKEWGSAHWAPLFRICAEQAAKLVGGDLERAEEILDGEVSLGEMPKEILKRDMVKERAEWVKTKAQKHRIELSALMGDDLGLEITK